VVTPVYNESRQLGIFAETVKNVLFSAHDINIRMLFVDDGSSDDTWAVINEIILSSDHFAAIRLSRNFGMHTALAAGFDHVDQNADAVATLACDLQDPPETILLFVKKWRLGADIVWGARKSRQESRWRRITSRTLEAVLRRYAMPHNSQFQIGSFFLIDRVVLDCVRQFREHARVTFALVAWTGFEQAVVEYDRRERASGRSGWTFGKMVNTAYDVFIGFSPAPAKALTILGFVLLAGSIFAVMYLVAEWYFRSVVPGWTGLMTTITLCFGLLFLMLGVSFEYLYRIFIETKNRPLYFVSRRLGDVCHREALDD